MSRRRYRVVKRLPWIEGGKPAPPPVFWEGGEGVTYEPGDTVELEDQDLPGIYSRLEALDDAGRAALEELRSQKSGGVITSLDAEECSALVWALAHTKVVQGEGMKEALIWAIRNRAKLPDDSESREWIADVLEGKLNPKRSRGRPKKQQPRDMIRSAVENSIARTYRDLLGLFQHDREGAWLVTERWRLREEQPDAALWRRREVNDLDTDEARRSCAADLAKLGARKCPPKTRGEEAARELALKTTAERYGKRWKDLAGKPLTPAVVARLVTLVETRAKKSK